MKLEEEKNFIYSNVALDLQKLNARPYTVYTSIHNLAIYQIVCDHNQCRSLFQVCSGSGLFIIQVIHNGTATVPWDIELVHAQHCYNHTALSDRTNTKVDRTNIKVINETIITNNVIIMHNT